MTIKDQQYLYRTNLEIYLIAGRVEKWYQSKEFLSSP